MSFWVNKRKKQDGAVYWRLMHTSWKDGRRTDHHIPVEQYLQHGFRPDMTLEEARARARQLNNQARLNKADVRAKTAALRSAKRSSIVASAFLPPSLVDGFLIYLKQEVAIGPHAEQKWYKTLCHWSYVQKMVASVALPPSQWWESRRRFYDYTSKQATSPNYASKVLRVLNLWGTYQARHTGQSFIPVPPPSGYDREMIADAYSESDKKKKTSEALTPEALEQARSRLPEAQWRWLYLTVWLGLRPPEADRITEAKLTKEQGVSVLWVYQSKLRGVRKEDRYKPIPLLYPEQKLCLKLMKQEIKRPLVKTVQRHVSHRLTLYGGRKGFTDLMLSKGQALEDISTWLGHSSIERTWRSYKQRQRVSFRPVGQNRKVG